jgi:hypothetical protein
VPNAIFPFSEWRGCCEKSKKMFQTRRGAAIWSIDRETVSVSTVFTKQGSGLAGPGDVCRNESFGHLLRSKGVRTQQGGVFMANAVVDNPLFVGLL